VAVRGRGAAVLEAAARVWWAAAGWGEEGQRPARVRIVGCLIPYREDVMHDILIRCIGSHIYRLHGG
jgi:hypothetical protein